MHITHFFRILRLEVFVDINGPVRGWGVDRLVDGVLITVWNVQITACHLR